MRIFSLPFVGTTLARIFARPRVEEVLTDASLLEAIFQGAPMVLFALDREGRVERLWNPRAQAAFGLSAAEALGRPLPVVLPGFEEELRRVLERVFEGESITDLAGQGILEDGPSFPVRLSITPVHGQAGRVESALVTFGEDLPQGSRLAALAGLLGEKAQILDVVRSAGIVIWAMVPRDRRLRHVSSAALEVLGIGREALLADVSALLQGLDDEGRAKFKQAREEALAGRMGRFEAPFAHAGKGRSVWTRWTLDLGGGLLRGVVQDVTEAQDLKEQLLHSQKLETVGEFLSTVTHDFNNILISILGYNELLLMDPALSPEQKRRLEAMQKGVNRGHALAGRLLRYVRRESSPHRNTDLNDLVREVVLLLEDGRSRGIRFQLDLAAGLPEVFGEPTELHQVVMNLMINARDAMPRGGRITARTRPAGGDGRSVLLEIEDTGPGIPEDVRGRIFDPFFTTKPSGAGTGLGLTLAHRVITAHGGTIRCLCAEGRGTLFEVLLPTKTARVSA